MGHCAPPVRRASSGRVRLCSSSAEFSGTHESLGYSPPHDRMHPAASGRGWIRVGLQRTRARGRRRSRKTCRQEFGAGTGSCTRMRSRCGARSFSGCRQKETDPAASPLCNAGHAPAPQRLFAAAKHRPERFQRRKLPFLPASPTRIDYAWRAKRVAHLPPLTIAQPQIRRSLHRTSPPKEGDPQSSPPQPLTRCPCDRMGAPTHPSRGIPRPVPQKDVGWCRHHRLSNHHESVTPI